MKEYLLNLGKDGLKNAYLAIQNFALYLVLILAFILILSGIIVKTKKPQSMQKFKSFALGTTIGFSVTLISIISLFTIFRLIIKEEVDTNFYLVFAFTILMLLSSIAFFITYFISQKAFNITKIICISVLVAYGVMLLFTLPTAGSEYAPLSSIGMYGFSLLLIAVAVLLLIFFGKEKNVNPSKSLSFAGITIALSFALSYIKIFSLPQGGSVTLASMLPLIVYSYIFGARKGVFVGCIYGLLQCIQSPQFYQPMQVILDYPVAFGLIGLSGICKNFNINKPALKFVLGATIGCFGRYVAHFLSGYYVFSSWAMEGYTALSWSLVYNLFVFADLLIVIFVGSILFSSKAFIKEIDGICK